jgi:TetR/AcrR family transcriptional regulator, repressor of fatR-cypB operon
MNIHSVMKSEPAKPSKGAPSRPSTRLITSDKREAITAAALELFVERGFFGTTVPEIAEHAEVGAGTIYRYFESKEALVNAIYREEKVRFAHLVIDDFRAVGAREQFRMLWMRMAKYAIAYPKSFIFLELHHHARYLDKESRELEQRMLGLFTNIVVSAQARGELRPAPPRLLMGLVMGSFVGVIRSCIEIDQPVDSADWTLAEQCMWEAIRV